MDGNNYSRFFNFTVLKCKRNILFEYYHNFIGDGRGEETGEIITESTTNVLNTLWNKKIDFNRNKPRMR